MYHARNGAAAFMKKYIELKSFKPDKSSPVALHLQLAKELLKQLRAVSPNSHYVLPSERTLVKQFEINRLTVHRAYAYLLENNLVVKNPDKSLSVANTARRKLQGAFPVIGIILPEKFSEYSKRPIAMEYLKGMIDRTTELGVSTMMLTPPLPGTAAHIVDEFIETHCANTSGIIHLGNRGMENDDVLEKILDYTGVPQVFISGYSDRPHIGSICADVTNGITGMCRAVREKGAEKIGIIFQPQQNLPSFIYNASRRVGQVKFLFEQNGFEVSFVNGFKNAADIKIDTDNIPDVFWCFNDEYAKALMKVLETHGIRVPQDVKVAGFDGVDNLYKKQKISTVRQKFYETGYSAIDLVLEHFKSGITDKNRIVKVETLFVSGDTL